MSVFAENVAQHSAQFLPSFRLLKGTPPEPPAQLPDLGIAIGRTRRHNGQLGIRPLPLDGQTELARYVGVVTAGAFMTAQGQPPRGPETAASTLKKICFGGGEMLLTERMLAVVISSGDTILGEVDESKGVVLALALRYRDIDTVGLKRKKALLGGLKAKAVEVIVHRPPTYCILEPDYRLDSTSQNPIKEGYEAFGEALVRAACDERFGDASDERERDRLARVRAGGREREDADLVAWISAPD